MIKKNKWQLIISSAIILLPILVGLILWNVLPEQFTTHWGADGQADGWSSKPFAIFLPPVFMLILHWICVFFTAADPKNKNQSPKAFGMVLWIVPVMSVLSSGMIYATALGMELSIGNIMPVVLGLMFALIGNYLPKCKQNRTIGIKVTWALNNEENWNATHRFGGKVWLVGGLVMMACGLLPGGAGSYGVVIGVVALAIIPTVYSYLYYRKQLQAGQPPIPKNPLTKWSLLVVAAFLVFLLLVCFTGDIQVDFRDTNFYIDSDRWDGLTVEYDAIDSIEYREEMVSGSRTNGFGSPRLLMGTFENEEFGSFTRYTYASCESCIVLTVGERTLVISGQDAEATKAIYQELLNRTEG